METPVHRCRIDHLVIVARTLDAGADYVHRALGVAPQAGGAHARMGTHNRLLRLGDTAYLEVIAVDPSAPPPGRPRWFALDALAADAPPKLAAWVAGTADIHAAQAAATEALGDIEPMCRGPFDWLITIPADGMPPLDGTGPALIQWQGDTHPAQGLADHGLSLARLELVHPDPARVRRLLASLEFDGPVTVTAGPAAALVPEIDTPAGRKTVRT